MAPTSNWTNRKNHGPTGAKEKQMKIPSWLQDVADELVEKAVGTEEAADRLVELVDTLVPLEAIPVVGETLEALSDIVIQRQVSMARDAWLEAQDAEARAARRAIREPFQKAAKRRRIVRGHVLGPGRLPNGARLALTRMAAERRSEGTASNR